MKRAKLFIGLTLLVAIYSCKKSNDVDTTGGTPPVVVTPDDKPLVDSATVTVVNGYGTGEYKVGDTVHIWSGPSASNTTFDKWTGYTALINNAGEWHNYFIMPSLNLTLTANQKVMPVYTTNTTTIKGVNISKNVYYAFPGSHKGLVFLLHGTSGSVATLLANYEWQQTIKDLVAAGYGVVVTESEETSLKTDLNGDGVIRWKTSPIDSVTNVDMGNIKAIRDTLYARGLTSPAVPVYSIGMSNGGAFSCCLSYLFKFKSGVSYCAQAYKIVFDMSTIPYQFCMAKDDDQPEVGATGNADALTNSKNLNSRGVCSKYFINDRSPVYAERFARRSDISITTSTAFFNELKKNNWLDAKNFVKANSDAISQACLANPSVYPTYNAFSLLQRDFVNGQLDVMFSGHQFYSDLNKTTIEFLDKQCQ